jgi:hypothetical protein
LSTTRSSSVTLLGQGFKTASKIGRQCCSNVSEQARHPLAIGLGPQPGRDLAALRADGGKAIEGCTNQLPGHDGSERVRRPPSSQGIHKPKPSCICGQEHAGARLISRSGGQYWLDYGGKGFFNASCAACLRRGLCGRGTTVRQ